MGILANNATGESPAVVPSLIKKETSWWPSPRGPEPGHVEVPPAEAGVGAGRDPGRMAALQDRVREELKKTVKGQKRREEILWAILDDPAVWDALRDQDRALELALRHARP